ncbi:MAG: hypothetical protein KC549_15415, partial [Myxococcales bacterium]|nr:hypothetical protein [Myxococcales bacterium]
MNLPAPATVPGGVDVHDGLARLCAGAGVSAGMVLLVGTLDAATVAPAPHAEPLVLDGPLCLAQGTAVVQPGGIEIFGVVAWTDQGIPRQLAGRIEGAVSGGLAVAGLPAPAAGSAPPPEARLELEVEAPRRAPRE